VISLSLESLPRPISTAIRSDMGIVTVRNEGRMNKTILTTVRTLTPLLTIRSVICRIFPMSRTKVKTRIVIRKGRVISFRM